MIEKSARPVGPPVPDWTPPPAPDGRVLSGRYCHLAPLRETDAAPLHAQFAGHDQLWDYMPAGPFGSAQDYGDWVRTTLATPGHMFYAVRTSPDAAPSGVASFLRIDPTMGSIEVGNICFAPALQRTRAATEAMFLMMQWAFAAGYRRYEWKCNALNHPSRRAAQRLGFSFEGVFRQHMVVKGRNRDTAWFACTDVDWPGLCAAFERWLDAANFDAQGIQLQTLGGLTAPVRVGGDPTLA
ncbi:MAG: GNAT family N-acetyltransferase [Rhodobacteraceae bacterium]|nr:GNAT family N-acetyltransferase [Paracoccaceae bacterium]